jgi:arginyl-tRNA synthetase
MLLKPLEYIYFNGNPGPFIQYTHARIRSILRKANDADISLAESVDQKLVLSQKETDLIKLLFDYPAIVEEAGKNYSPALIANFVYDMAKEYNQFYHDHTIVKEENEAIRNFRLLLSDKVSQVIKSGSSLLGMQVPERM